MKPNVKKNVINRDAIFVVYILQKRDLKEMFYRIYCSTLFSDHNVRGASISPAPKFNTYCIVRDCRKLNHKAMTFP
jgi:hypothetical protein